VISESTNWRMRCQGAFPEPARATITDGQALVALAHSGRQPRCDPRLVDRTPPRVAAQTARDRLRRASEVESIAQQVGAPPSCASAMKALVIEYRAGFEADF
jgi:hypothetical protein